MSLLTNLISYWKLDEASGTRVDSIGGNNLTDNNTVTQAAGKVGNAAQFTAANSEYLSHASNAALQTGNIDFTFAFWVYLDTTSGVQVLLAKAASSGLDEYLFHHQSSRFQFWVQTTTVPVKVVANSFGAPSAATFYLVVGWHDAATDTVNIQINNGTVDSVPTSGAIPRTEANAFLLGAYNVGNLVPTNGRLDEVGFWKRVLTTDERSDLWNGGNGTSYPFTQSVSITGSGGVVVGGSATIKRGRAITGSGGILASGAATLKRGVVIVGSGGVLVGGTGFNYFPRIVSASAGLSSHQKSASLSSHSYTASKPSIAAEAGG